MPRRLGTLLVVLSMLIAIVPAAGAARREPADRDATTPGGRATHLAAAEMIPADGLVYLSAHRGEGKIMNECIDPSVTDESDPTSVDPSLDMYNPDNGPPYSAEFVERYRAAQVARNHRITAWALAELDRVRNAGCFDRMFNLHRA